MCVGGPETGGAPRWIRNITGELELEKKGEIKEERGGERKEKEKKDAGERQGTQVRKQVGDNIVLGRAQSLKGRRVTGVTGDNRGGKQIVGVDRAGQLRGLPGCRSVTANRKTNTRAFQHIALFI
jgi:hypothetical protein